MIRRVLPYWHDILQHSLLTFRCAELKANEKIADRVTIGQATSVPRDCHS